jgi:hypothetical protein
MRNAMALCQSQGVVTAQGKRAAPEDPHLDAVVTAWPELPDAIKAGIMAMVKAASK